MKQLNSQALSEPIERSNSCFDLQYDSHVEVNKYFITSISLHHLNARNAVASFTSNYKNTNTADLSEIKNLQNNNFNNYLLRTKYY